MKTGAKVTLFERPRSLEPEKARRFRVSGEPSVERVSIDAQPVRRLCYPRAEFRTGARDVYLGAIAGTPFYIGERQFEYWKHTHLTIDVMPRRGGGFSLETPEGKRFLVRSRLFSDDEYHALEAEGPPPRGEQTTP